MTFVDSPFLLSTFYSRLPTFALDNYYPRLELPTFTLDPRLLDPLLVCACVKQNTM